MKDKSKVEERVESLLRRIEKLRQERDELAQVNAAAAEVVEQRRQAEAKAKTGLLRQRKKNQTDEEFVNSCLAAIDQKVKELNAELEASAGSVSDERRILKEMQRVRATKNQIPLYLQRSKALQEARAQGKRAERDLESKESFIKTLESELAELRAEVSALDGKEQAEQKPVKDALSTEEEQLTEELNNLYAQLRATKDGLNENREKWFAARHEKQRLAAEKVQQRKIEENAKREEERKKIEEEERQVKKLEVPYANEIRELKALLTYLDQLAQENEVKEEPRVTPAAPAPAAAEPKLTTPAGIPANAKVLVPGNRKPLAQDDDWGTFASENKKGKKKNNDKPVKKTEKKATKFVINLYSLEQFKKLGFDAPLSYEEIPKVRTQVAARHQEFLNKSSKEKQALMAQIAADAKSNANSAPTSAPAPAPAAAPADK